MNIWVLQGARNLTSFLSAGTQILGAKRLYRYCELGPGPHV